MGDVDGGKRARRTGQGTAYMHNAETWRALWEGVVVREEWKGLVAGVEVESEMRDVGAQARGR